MTNFTPLWIIASSSAVLAAACAKGVDGVADPSGDIEISGDAAEVAVGEVINLTWEAKDAAKVWVRLLVDGEESAMLSEAGYGSTGSTEFVVDQTAFSFETDDDVDLKFQLLARDENEAEYEVLDETRVIEVAKPGEIVDN